RTRVAWPPARGLHTFARKGAPMTRRFTPLFAVLLFLLAACGPAAAPSPTPTAVAAASATASPAAFPTTLSDFQNRSVTIPQKPQRIVSIGPSITEFLFAIGAGARVVGTDDFSDEPAAAKTLEKLGGIKVSFEKVVALKPDLVLIVKFSDGTIEKLASAGLLVMVVDPQSVGDVARTATLLGQATGEDGSALAAKIDQQVQAVKSRVAGATTTPRVYHEIDASDPTNTFTVGP